MNPDPPAVPDAASVAQKSNSETGGERTSSFHDYLKNKLRITEVVQAILHQARQRRDALVEAECQQLLSRLASDRFNLVVVGQFNRGKSTLMNAILGIDRLPTGVLPLTSVITSVGYGDRERVLLHRSGEGLPIEVPLAQLADHVTEAGNPGNRKGIAIAEVQLPIELLRLGFHFVDTPGVGSVIVENTRTTKAFLPEADAAIFVTSFDSPLDERELDLLTEVLDHVRQVFVVVNKSDIVSAEQKNVVTSFVRSRLPERLTVQRAVLFPVSALQAMRSRMEGDARGLDESGLLELERALVRFLKVEKSREFLLRVADRTEALLRKQEDLVRLSEQNLTSPERRAEFAVRLRRRADALHGELRGIVDQAKVRSVAAIRRRLEPDLDLWSQRLAGILVERARDWLSGASFEDLLGESDALAPRISDICRDLTAPWLAERHQALARDIETELRRAGPLVNHILDDASKMSAESPQASGSSVSSTAMPWTPQVGDAMPWPAPPVLEWTPGLLVCGWMIPAPPFKRLVLNGLSRRLRASLRTYGDRILQLFDRALEEFIERHRANFDTGIEAEASRLLNALPDETIGDHACAVADLRHRLDSLRAEFEATPLEEPDTERPEPLDASVNVRDRYVPNAHAVCVICQRVVAALFEYMSAKQYSLSVNESEQRQHALASGFCSLHSWYYATIASPQGTCLAYPPLLDVMAARLRALANSAASSQSLVDGIAELLPTSVRCPACQLVGTLEKTSAKEIVGALTEGAPDAQSSFPPLCLVHLHAVLNAKPGTEQSRSLVQAQAGVFERIAEDMRTSALKHDAIRRELVTNEEHHAHRTALLRLVGHRNSGRGAP